jgi:hypothetical protein
MSGLESEGEQDTHPDVMGGGVSGTQHGGVHQGLGPGGGGEDLRFWPVLSCQPATALPNTEQENHNLASPAAAVQPRWCASAEPDRRACLCQFPPLPVRWARLF